MRRKFPLSILLLLTLAMWSCKKEGDTQRPQITFLEPAVNISIFLPDTIKVVARISDDKIITGVELGLVNDQGSRILVGGFYYPNVGEYTMTSYFPLTDKSITSGNYSLKVTATDGYNITNAYLPVIIHEVPLELDGYLVVSASLPFETRITRLSLLNASDTSFIIPESFLLSGVNGLWEQFYYVTGEPSTIYSYSVNNFKPLWEFGAELPRPVITGLMTDEEMLFASANGDAVILDEQGNIELRTAPEASKTIQSFAADETYLYAEMVSLSGVTRQITAFYRVSGVIRVQRTVANDVTGLLAMSGKALMVLSSGIRNELSEFDPEEMLITGLLEFDPGTVLSCMKISPDEALIFEVGRVLYYNYSQNYLGEYLDKGYRFGRYDRSSDRLFLVSDSSVDVYSASSATYLQSLEFGEPVKDFQVILNKK